MALTTKNLRIEEEPPLPEIKRGRGRPAWEPEPLHRQLVEILVSLGATQEAICRELSRQGVPCKDVTTLQRHFAEEVAHGKERRILAYGVKIHSVAMSDGPAAWHAARYMLQVMGGPQWRVPKEDDGAHGLLPDDDKQLLAAGRVAVVMPDNRRGFPSERPNGAVKVVEADDVASDAA
jgi:hypothetical protein